MNNQTKSNGSGLRHRPFAGLSTSVSPVAVDADGVMNAVRDQSESPTMSGPLDVTSADINPNPTITMVREPVVVAERLSKQARRPDEKSKKRKSKPRAQSGARIIKANEATTSPAPKKKEEKGDERRPSRQHLRGASHGDNGGKPRSRIAELVSVLVGFGIERGKVRFVRSGDKTRITTATHREATLVGVITSRDVIKLCAATREIGVEIIAEAGSGIRYREHTYLVYGLVILGFEVTAPKTGAVLSQSIRDVFVNMDAEPDFIRAQLEKLFSNK